MRTTKPPSADFEEKAIWRVGLVGLPLWILLGLSIGGILVGVPLFMGLTTLLRRRWERKCGEVWLS